MDDQPQPIGSSFDLGRAFGNAFTAIRYAAGPMWLAGMLMSISDGCGNAASLPEMPGMSDDDSGAWSALPRALLTGSAQAFALGQASLEGDEIVGWALGLFVAVALVAVLVGLALFAFHCWVQTGFIRLHVNILEHCNDELASLFSGKDRFWPMAGFKLLAGLSLWATGAVAIWPGALLCYVGYARDSNALMIGGVGAMLILAVPALVYVALGVFLGDLAVALEGHGPVHALRRSFALARGNRMPLFAFGFASMLLQMASVAGLLLCCVGVLATVPFARAVAGFAKTESFLLFTRGLDQTAAWRMWQRKSQDDRPWRHQPPPAAPGSA